MATGRSLLLKFVLAITSVFVSFGSAEVFLRASGYALTAPITLQFSGFDPLKDVTVDDADVLWRFKANDEVSFSGLHFKTTAIGTRGVLPAREKQKDVLRVLCLGDSTAFGNWVTYPDELSSILAANTDRPVEVINGGIPGFSAQQGYRLFLRDLAVYQPDIITWCFGFNNAKESAGGVPDALRLATLETSLGRLRFQLSKLRVFRVLEKRVAGLRPQSYAFTESGNSIPLRCPPAEHAELLRAMATWAKEHGAAFVPITQPHAYRTAALEAPGVLDAEVGKIIRTRLDEQNDAVRKTATELKLPLVDMRTDFDSISGFEPFTEPFPGGDSIHHNALGVRAFAWILAARLGQLGLVPLRSTLPVEWKAARFPFALACDVEGDGGEEIITGTYTDRLELSVVNPLTRTSHRVEAQIAPPTRECSIQFVPLLPERIAITTATSDGFRLDTLKTDGGSGSFQLTRSLGGFGSRTLRIMPFDRNADGRPEYAIDLGRLGSDKVIILSEQGSPLLTWNNPVDRKQGCSLTSLRHDNGRERILISGLVKGKGVVFQDGASGYPVPRDPLDLEVHSVPCVTVTGNFDISTPADELACLRGFTLVTGIESTEGFEFCFPFDPLSFDVEKPTLSATVLRDEKGRKTGILIASATEHGVEVIAFDRSGVRPFASLPLP